MLTAPTTIAVPMAEENASSPACWKSLTSWPEAAAGRGTTPWAS